MKRKSFFIVLFIFFAISLLSACAISNEKFTITTLESENGVYICNHLEAKANDDVSITIIPDEGYRFDFLMVNNKKVYDTKFDMPKCNVNLKVYFTPIVYNINYMKDDDMFFEREHPNTYTIEEEVVYLGHLIKYGYTFQGWYTDINLTNKIEKIDKGTTGDIFLYPKHTLNTNTINYHIDAETTNEGNPTTFTVIDETITLQDPIKEGYEFRGWFTNKDFNGNRVTKIESGSFLNLDLYPKFVTNKRDEKGFRLIETQLDFETLFIDEYIQDEKYKLCTDIDLSGKIWQPRDFLGEFDGGEHTISNINIETRYISSIKDFGFFSTLNGAKISNLKLSFNINVNIKNTNENSIYTIGGIAGSVINNSFNEISNIQILSDSKMNIYSTSDLIVGGIIGVANDNTTISYSKVTDLEISIESLNMTMVGGISGRYGNISGCGVNLKNVGFNIKNFAKTDGVVLLAGIMAEGNRSTIKNCYFKQEGKSQFKIYQNNSNSENIIAGILADSIYTETKIDCCYSQVANFEFCKKSNAKNMEIKLSGISCAGKLSNSFVSYSDDCYNFVLTNEGEYFNFYNDLNNEYTLAYISLSEPINSFAINGDFYLNNQNLNDLYIHDSFRVSKKSLIAINEDFKDVWDNNYWIFSTYNLPVLRKN